MEERNKNSGNDYYFWNPNKEFNPPIPNKKIERKVQNGFGGLGGGILRPYSKPYLKPVIPFDPNRKYVFRPKVKLSDQDQLDELTKKIADSIKVKIDEELKKQQKEDKVEAALVDKKGMPVGLIIVFSAAALLAVGMVFEFTKQMKKGTPKKVIPK